MKQVFLFLTLTSVLFSQNVEDGEVDQTAPPVVVETTSTDYYQEPTKKSSTDTRNWVFAAGSLVAAAIAIVVVSLNPGEGPPSTNSP